MSSKPLQLVPKNKFAPKINVEMAEKLFQMWISGMQLKAIHEVYRNTPQAFHYQTLKDLKEKNDWEGRRNAILSELQDETKEQIKQSYARQLSSARFLLEIHIDQIQKLFVQYQNDREGFFREAKKTSWMPRNTRDLVCLMAAYDRLVQVTNVYIEEEKQQMNTDFTDEEEDTIYEILKNSADRKAMGGK